MRKRKSSLILLLSNILFQQPNLFTFLRKREATQTMGPSLLQDNNHQQERHLEYYQSVVVMRHGDRMDNVDKLWAKTAPRPWDPPLAKEGLERAFKTGWKLRTDLGFPIHRVFVSPFLRCVQTASEVVSALCAFADNPDATCSLDVDIDPSKIKVSIEYGLCEMFNREAIRPNVAPKDGNFDFNVSELEAMLPAGTVDHSVERVYRELPQWEETVMDARARYQEIIQALANKYPSQNLLLVTHGEGVGSSVSAFLKDVTVCKVEYCAYSKLRRPVSRKDYFTSGDLEVLNHPGISYCPSVPTTSGAMDDVQIPF